MNWKQLFRKTMIRRGEALFRAGRVREVASAGRDTYEVLVRNRIPYRVTVAFQPDGSFRAGCSCGGWRPGVGCEHLVAALFALEATFSNINEIRPGLSPDSVIHPFEDVSEAEERPGSFHFHEKVSPLATTVRAWQQAQRILEDPSSCRFTAGTVFAGEDPPSGEKILVSRLICPDGAEASLRVSREEILELACSGPECEGELCSHQASLIALTAEALKIYPLGDLTTGEAYHLADRLIRRTDLALLREVLHLTPLLTKDAGILRLGVKIGMASSKAYVVPSISELIEAWTTGIPYRTGSSFATDFSRADWDEASSPLADLLRDGCLSSRSDQGTIPLTGMALDRFCDLMDGSDVRFLDRDSAAPAGMLKVGGSLPRLPLELVPLRESGRIAGLHLSGELPPVFHGIACDHILIEDSLIRLEGEARELFALLGQSGMLDLTFGESLLQDFVHALLPALRKIFDIHGVESLDEIDIPRPSFAFELSAQEGTIACRGWVSYEGERHALLPAILNDWDRGRLLEVQTIRLIEAFFPLRDPSSGSFLMKDEPDMVLRLLEEGIPALKAWGQVTLDERLSSIKIFEDRPLKILIDIEDTQHLTLSFRSEAFSSDEIPSLLEAFRSGATFTRLRSGSLLRFGNWTRALELLLEDLCQDLSLLQKGRLRLPPAALFYLERFVREHPELPCQESDSFHRMAEELVSPGKDPATVLRLLGRYDLGCLIHDPSASPGRLLLDLLASSKKETVRDVPSLVLCPRNRISVWEKDLTEVFGSGHDILLYSFDAAARDDLLARETNFDLLIIDGAEMLLSRKSKFVTMIERLRKRRMLAICRTDPYSHMENLWTLLDLVFPGLLPSYEKFLDKQKREGTGQGSPFRSWLVQLIDPLIIHLDKKGQDAFFQSGDCGRSQTMI